MEPDGQTDPVRVRSIFEKRSSDADATGLFFLLDRNCVSIQ